MPITQALRASLRAAWDAADEVRVRRRLSTDEKVHGYIVSMGDEWCLVALIADHLTIDGFSALRLDDIRGVERKPSERSLSARLLQRQDKWPVVAPPGIDLSTTQRLVESAAWFAGLVGLSYEEHLGDSLHIGVPLRVTKRNRLEVVTISPEAIWNSGVMVWPLRVITRVDFSSGYNEALRTLGGDPPPR